MKLRWSQRALGDLRQIFAYIARDNPVAARNHLAKLRKRARSAAVAPYTEQMVAELANPELREVIYGNYRLVYLVQSSAIVMQTVFEAHRLLPIGDTDE